MSNNLLASPIGLDDSIQRLQTKLYASIGSRWSGTLEGYGRAYRNIDKKGNFKYEWYNALKKDYQDVYYNDSSSDAVFFFVESGASATTDRLAFTNTVKLIVMCNLKKVVPSASNERKDQEVHRDILEFLRNANVITISGIETDIDTIFSGVETKGIEFSNIHPLHCFAVNLTVNYYLNDKC